MSLALLILRCYPSPSPGSHGISYANPVSVWFRCRISETWGFRQAAVGGGPCGALSAEVSANGIAVCVPPYAASMRLFCAHYAPSMRPLCALYAPTMRPLCVHYAPTMRPLFFCVVRFQITRAQRGGQ